MAEMTSHGALVAWWLKALTFKSDLRDWGREFKSWRVLFLFGLNPGRSFTSFLWLRRNLCRRNVETGKYSKFVYRSNLYAWEVTLLDVYNRCGSFEKISGFIKSGINNRNRKNDSRFLKVRSTYGLVFIVDVKTCVWKWFADQYCEFARRLNAKMRKRRF